MSVVVKEMRKGVKYSLWAMGDGRSFETLDFLVKLKKDDQRCFDKINALFARCVDHGPPRNIEKCRKFKNSEEIFELKTGDGVRILWFWDAGNLMICTHGFIKKRQKTPIKQIKYAEARRTAYFESRGNGLLVTEGN